MATTVEAPMVGKILKIDKNVGDHVDEDDVVIVMEAMKMEIPIVAPVSGTVVAVHDLLNKNPHSLNVDPESAGWMFEIELSHPKELDRLMNLKEYQALISPLTGH
mgnify:CR=1 FL=1